MFRLCLNAACTIFLVFCTTVRASEHQHVISPLDVANHNARTFADATSFINKTHDLPTLSLEHFTHFSHQSIPLYTPWISKAPRNFRDPTVDSYTGYLDVGYGARHIFFYFFESRRDPSKDDVIMWINGCEPLSLVLELLYQGTDLEVHVKKPAPDE